MKKKHTHLTGCLNDCTGLTFWPAWQYQVSIFISINVQNKCKIFHTCSNAIFSAVSMVMTPLICFLNGCCCQGNPSLKQISPHTTSLTGLTATVCDMHKSVTGKLEMQTHCRAVTDGSDQKVEEFVPALLPFSHACASFMLQLQTVWCQHMRVYHH